MKNKALQHLTERIAKEVFGKSFQHQAYFNHRLITTGGRYMLKTHHIEINPKQYEIYGKEAIIRIIKHELCHYFLHLEEKGYQHKDQDFKRLSHQVGAPRYCDPVKNYHQRVRYLYRCTTCGQQYPRIRRVNTQKLRCGKCHGVLHMIHKY